jgi:MerR family transcriptional regulator, light-induced transcriptional regulator
LYLDNPAVEPNSQSDLYRIGTVASLTGLSVERLRAWERRYDISPAHKEGKTRFYSRSQLERLKLIKHLIDQGQAISSLATLTKDQLAERVTVQPPEPVLHSMHAPKVGLVGPNLIMLEQQVQQDEPRRRLEVVSRWANMEAFFSEVNATDNPQVLVLQVPVLSLHVIDKARKIFPQAKIVSIYQFATAQNVSKVAEMEIPTLKWPVTWAEIEHNVISEAGMPAHGGRHIPRRFSDEELIAIAADSEDPTQCPEHLIEAIHQLNAFAAYAEQCSTTAANGQVYRLVQADTTQARAQLETALESLIASAS